MQPLPAKVLIVRTGAIGDVTNALLVANAIKQARPEVRVGWVVHELARPLVDGHPSVDRVHLWRRDSGLGGLLALGRELRAEGYGLALDLQRIAKSGLLARLSGAERVLGFDRARSKELGWLWATEHLAPNPGSRHMVEWYLESVRRLGLPYPEPLHRLPADPAAAAWAEEQLAQLGGPGVLLNLGASKPPNRWDPERWGGLAGALRRDPGLPVCLLGGPDEREAEQRALAASGSGVHSLVGRTSLPQLIEVLRRARLVISCDTGPMHLACALGTPVVALFGPADPRRTGPWGEAHRVVHAPRMQMTELGIKPVLTVARERLTSLAPDLAADGTQDQAPDGTQDQARAVEEG